MNCRLLRRGAGLARLAAARRRRQPAPDADHVRPRAASGGCTEWEVPWLPGYEGSAPGADRQRRARPAPARRLRRGHGRAASGAARRAGAGATPAGRCSARCSSISETIWREPDEGIWEVRGPRRALHPLEGDGLGRVRPRGQGRRGVRARRARSSAGASSRDEIHDEVCRTASTRARSSFVQSYGSQQLDASLLLMPLVGFLPPDDPRIAGHRRGDRAAPAAATGSCCATTRREVADGLPPGEGAFLACSFWLADDLRPAGPPRRGARAVRAAARRCATTSACWPRSTTPRARRQVGNFPQAFSHVALVNTAITSPAAPKPAEQRADG